MADLDERSTQELESALAGELSRRKKAHALEMRRRYNAEGRRKPIRFWLLALGH
jgi:hypothetical protein